jgi:hypothetical protein
VSQANSQFRKQKGDLPNKKSRDISPGESCVADARDSEFHNVKCVSHVVSKTFPPS